MACCLFLAVLATSLASPEARPDAPEVLTLSRALEIALAAHPGVRASPLAVERAEATVSAARTNYFPALSLEASLGRLLVPVEMDFPQGAFGTLPSVGEIPASKTTVKSPPTSPSTWARRCRSPSRSSSGSTRTSVRRGAQPTRAGSSSAPTAPRSRRT